MCRKPRNWSIVYTEYTITAERVTAMPVKSPRVGDRLARTPLVSLMHACAALCPCSTRLTCPEEWRWSGAHSAGLFHNSLRIATMLVDPWHRRCHTGKEPPSDRSGTGKLAPTCSAVCILTGLRRVAHGVQ